MKSSTKVLASLPRASPQVNSGLGGGGYESHSRSIRKIDNGYITREEHSTGDSYKSSEKYTPDHPDKVDSQCSMKAAIAECNK